MPHSPLEVQTDLDAVCLAFTACPRGDVTTGPCSRVQAQRGRGRTASAAGGRGNAMAVSRANQDRASALRQVRRALRTFPLPSTLPPRQ